jgi:glutamate synthase (ferredoxin)
MPESHVDHVPLYDDTMEHDGCGVGFIADLRGRSRRDVVVHGLGALERLTHRGAPESLGAVDGCGVLTAIPWPLLEAEVGHRFGEGRSRALGMFFVPRGQAERAIRTAEHVLRDAGAEAVFWRPVRIDSSAVLPAQRGSTPAVLQAIIALRVPPATADAVLYRARLRIERVSRRMRLGLTVVSLSTATVVYKALVPPARLERFYRDLSDPRFVSPFVVFHQRFSTNTSTDWALAQPFRSAAHNGEINTIAGNRLWMRARLADRTSLPGFGRYDPVRATGSDSQSLDDAIELLIRHGYSLDHAVSRLMPPSWEKDDEMGPEIRAFFEYQSLVSEPWDGPTALVFADGRHVGAALDRNGFRPMRIVSTDDDLLVAASEVGVLPEGDHEIVERSRLGPGEIVVVDLVQGGVKRSAEIRAALAAQQPYQRMVAGSVSSLPAGEFFESTDGWPADATLAQRQAAAGLSREEIDVIIGPMSVDGREAVGSMGDDTPPAMLSRRSRVLFDFFRQRFAQVTNPPIDPYRETSAMSLRTLIGAHGRYLDELDERPPRIVLPSPVLTQMQFDQLQSLRDEIATRIPLTFALAGGEAAFAQALTDLADDACRAVEDGASLVVLSDRGVDVDHAALPSLLATSAVHHALIARGLRMRVSLIVESGDARDPHQIAALFAYGASAVYPYIAYATVAAVAAKDGLQYECLSRYRTTLERGLLTIMSKMGVCTFSGYCGAQLFEILGLDREVVDRFFPGAASSIGGAPLADIASATIRRHREAFAEARPLLGYPGLHTYRRDGEYHATNPAVVRHLHAARDGQDEEAYARFIEHVYRRPPTAIRDLLAFLPGTPCALDEVESADDICRRFFASAMSVGALSPEAHRVVARAMNRIGARSNSGEGGEEPDRLAGMAPFTDCDGSRTKQVASARFGVTPAYLRSADELQIKIAQGSKPGEGGQLPAVKVVEHIARLRHAQPGTPLISPPVHHDVYSIEDLAQLIDDLRAVNPSARINVKLVASHGVSVIAAGVVKAGADAIQISGHDGGTGASPRSSIKHVGLPWEIGLAETHQVLARAGLRDRVALQVDGGLKTGRDVAMAAALGADEYGFGTAALVAIGCVMARQCHLNTCPVGIATQRDDLRGRFDGTPEMLIGYLRLVAGEVRSILASMKLTRLEDLIGRSDLLQPRRDIATSEHLLLDSLVSVRSQGFARSTATARHACTDSETRHAWTATSAETPGPDRPLIINTTIGNTDRSFGAGIAGAIAERFGDRGLPDGSVKISVAGSAGQSFGAFALPGMSLALVGDANDGVGKGMHGGEIVIMPPAKLGTGVAETGVLADRLRPVPADPVVAGNSVLYGATGGRVFLAGAAGERFAVRNSGAIAVVEGVGDHACEYMTGGTVVVLGAIGRNFASGMSGGAAYVCDEGHRLSSRCRIAPAGLDAADRAVLRELLTAHISATGSRRAARIVREELWSHFWKAVPSAEIAAPTPREHEVELTPLQSA